MTPAAKARTNGGVYTPSSGGTIDSGIESSTIGSGDTYSAIDGWDDVIKDQNDYTTGSGEHIKVPTYFDHVAEDDSGNIYVGNSWDDIPSGTTDLSPTQIGDEW